MHIRQRVERFLRHHPISATRFGREALRDPGFVRGLRGGREPRPITVERVEHFMNKAQQKRTET